MGGNPDGRKAVEIFTIMTSVNNISGGAQFDFCDEVLVGVWLRTDILLGNRETSSMSNSSKTLANVTSASMNSTMISCRLQLLTEPMTVQLGHLGNVLSISPTGPPSPLIDPTSAMRPLTAFLSGMKL